MHTPHAVCLFNMVYCSSTIHVPHTVQQNRHHRYRKDLHMFILMCVQQTDRRRRLTDLSFCLKKEKRFTECNEEMLAEWLGHPVLHTHTHTSCCFHQAPVRHNSSGGTCSLRTKNSLLHGVRPRLMLTPAER